MADARRVVFTRRADTATSTMALGVFGWAARESRGTRAAGPSDPVGEPEIPPL